VPVVCRECGRRWKVSPDAVALDCARCGGADVEVDEIALDTLKRIR
jgi:Zn finger protein HypA/HybF involved in hydrogenase expression